MISGTTLPSQSTPGPPSCNLHVPAGRLLEPVASCPLQSLMRVSIMHCLPGTLSSVWHLTLRDGSHTCHCLPFSRWARAGGCTAQQERRAASTRRCLAAAAAKPLALSTAPPAACSADPFYSPADVLLDSVGYHPAVVDALRAAGYQRPSQVQVLAAYFSSKPHKSP